MVCESNRAVPATESGISGCVLLSKDLDRTSCWIDWIVLSLAGMDMDTGFSDTESILCLRVEFMISDIEGDPILLHGLFKGDESVSDALPDVPDEGR